MNQFLKTLSLLVISAMLQGCDTVGESADFAEVDHTQTETPQKRPANLAPKKVTCTEQGRATVFLYTLRETGFEKSSLSKIADHRRFRPQTVFHLCSCFQVVCWITSTISWAFDMGKMDAFLGPALPVPVKTSTVSFSKKIVYSFPASKIGLQVCGSSFGLHSLMGARMDFSSAFRIFESLSAFERDATGKVVYKAPSHITGTY